MRGDRRDQFEHVRNVDVQGGQGRSYQARDMSNGSLVFVKELRRKNSTVARKRFRREVVAYETLAGAGLPTLIYDNSSEWQRPSGRLLMVLEWIDGLSLRQKVEQDGQVPLQVAATCVMAVGKALSECHAAGVIHRDIKPANVMLRRGALSDPVLVDFGLSFNDTQLDDVTHVEEIGNRFLRLPEHAAEGNSRSHLSDVTQLAGLLFYCLTGSEPRVLSDEEGRAPHQRYPARDGLARLVHGRQFLRLNAVFDQAFDTRLSKRFQRVEALMEAIEVVLETGDDMNSDDFEVQFQDAVEAPRHVASAELDTRLRLFTSKTEEVVYRLALSHSLQSDQTGHTVQPAAETPFGETQMRLWPSNIDPNQPPIPRTVYRFEVRGNEIVFQADCEDLWRGDSVDDIGLASAIETAAKRALVQALNARG
ncbi:serine/threonine protein kinase [Rhodococcus aetherivorans]|uniref:serine/threonine protein kinase n=1 Tax=Rhodococcus aetherivorans TaxID=191292 RepID=UPI00366B8DD6